ncbi:hypothetical protein JCM10207_002107 [Rhodosporidiobolus poonsookiae]
MSASPSRPRVSFARRLLGRKPEPVIDEEKVDEKVDEVGELEMLPELEAGQVDTAFAFVAAHTYHRCLELEWIRPLTPSLPVDAVAIRRAKDSYVLHPSLADERVAVLRRAVEALNCEAAVTVSADVVRVVAAAIPPHAQRFSLSSDTHIQVVDTLADLAHVRKAQHACFVRDERRLVVWADKVGELEATVQDFEAKLVRYGSLDDLPGAIGEKETEHDVFADNKSSSGDAESALSSTAERRLPLNHSIYTGLAVSLDIVICALIARKLVAEALLDKSYTNLPILAVLPFMFCICLFFAEYVITVLAQSLAPIGQMSVNSLYYSALPPPRTFNGPLPHISIFLPVYKESLDDVLAPTIESVTAAIRTYELQGGTASIIVCEDGLQLVDAEEIERRKEYYDRWRCAYVARPKENRAGRFKKSSNMNVTIELSLRVEAIMDERRPNDLDDLAAWTAMDEENLYEAALATALEEKENVVWANGNIRVGELILLIDSDTRVPRDCFLDAACEMESSPEVAILQHSSGVFKVGAGYFEDFIGFFTTVVNHSISYAVANGAAAPFMGHNAFLRWSALQHAALDNPNGKVWSEEHVSEDFVQTLCINRAGYITRWATYSNGEFKEGVSLSVDDELNRWQKYAFGCSEIIFRPIKSWFRGPMSPLFAKYLWGQTPLPTKVSHAAYLASYYSIAVAPPLNLAYYCCQSWFSPELSTAFMAPFGTWLGVIVVFSGGGMVATVLSRYRSQSAPLFRALKDAVVWLPYLVLFFAGVQFHVLTALCAHVTSYNMTWTTTKKDLDTPTIGDELPRVARRHWLTFLLAAVTIGGVAVLTTHVVPLGWRVTNWTILFPILWMACGHILAPILLNPSLTLFRF